jgi:excisionase family DNA binding protein
MSRLEPHSASGEGSAAVLIRPEEAAQRLSVGRTQVYALIASGALPSVKIGRLRRVPVVALEAFVSALRAGQEPRPSSAP